MIKKLILVLNPGSTSTKFALFEEEKMLFEKTLAHSHSDIADYKNITDQFEFRKNLIIQELNNRNCDLGRIAVVVGRGGLVKPIESGIYEVNEKMIADLKTGLLGQHASNLGGIIAHDIALTLPDAKAYIVDPVVVDELQPLARISGHPAIERISIFHALNQKAVARMYAATAGKNYEYLNLIIAHMGGGISVGAHKRGKVVDVNNALADLCFSGQYSHAEIKSMITGKGGMVAYLGTNSFKDVCKMAEEGDKKAILIRDAAAYQVSKEIGAMAAVLEGNVDAIILTGGLTFNESFVNRIKSMVQFIAKVMIYPGEDEIRSLAFNGLLALNGKIAIKTYT